MVGGRARAVASVALALGLSACSDQVVGQFDGGETGSDSSGGPTVGESADETAAAAEPVCFGDDFDDEQLDPEMWNSWTEEFAVVEELSGWVKFTPATVGLFDAGIVANHLHHVPFEDGWARMQVPTPPQPERPVLVFLQVIDEPWVLSIALTQGHVDVFTSDDADRLFQEQVDVDAYPGWIGLRTEDGTVYFESSDDGETWTTLTTAPMPAAMPDAHPLVMAQTYGADETGGFVAVDNLEVCVR